MHVIQNNFLKLNSNLYKFSENDISSEPIHLMINLSICAYCESDVSEGDAFCTVCGKLVAGNSKKENSKKVDSKKEDSKKPSQTLEKVPTPSSQSKKVETTKTSDGSNTGNLVLPDGSKIEIDKSQRLVGRVDLAQFSDDDSENISRGHFTVFEDNGTYYIQDGSTNVQEKPSKNHTFKNEEDITDKGRVQLSDDDIIKVSTVEINFKLE